MGAQEAGRGRHTIVLWPAIFTDHTIYEGLVDRLGHRYRFLLIDGPGHGRSVGIPETFTTGDCGNAIASVMDAYGLDRAILGGTSWGSLAAAELCLRHPERVSALVLMNTPWAIDGRKPGFSKPG